MNNLRQIGIAVAGYHESIGALPFGRTKMYDPRYAGSNYPCSSPSLDKSFLVQILTYLEEAPLYNSINQSLSIVGRENMTAWVHPVATFACPSDVGATARHRLDPAYLPTYGIPDLSDITYEMVFTS